MICRCSIIEKILKVFSFLELIGIFLLEEHLEIVSFLGSHAETTVLQQVFIENVGLLKEQLIWLEMRPQSKLLKSTLVFQMISHCTVKLLTLLSLSKIRSFIDIEKT